MQVRRRFAGCFTHEADGCNHRNMDKRAHVNRSVQRQTGGEPVIND